MNNKINQSSRMERQIRSNFFRGVHIVTRVTKPLADVRQTQGLI